MQTEEWKQRSADFQQRHRRDRSQLEEALLGLLRMYLLFHTDKGLFKEAVVASFYPGQPQGPSSSPSSHGLGPSVTEHRALDHRGP